MVFERAIDAFRDIINNDRCLHTSGWPSFAILCFLSGESVSSSLPDLVIARNMISCYHDSIFYGV